MSWHHGTMTYTVHTTIRLPKTLHNAGRLAALSQGVSFSEFVKVAVMNHLNLKLKKKNATRKIVR